MQQKYRELKMEERTIMDILEYSGDGFNVIKRFGSWRIGFLKYSERFSVFNQLERHMATDESFALLNGDATLYTDLQSVKMEKCKLYNISKGEWHHIVVSKDATVIVIENSDTSAENTEIRFLKGNAEQ